MGPFDLLILYRFYGWKNHPAQHSIADPVSRCAIGSINSHYFQIIGDGHQPNSRGLYTHYKDSVIKGGMTIPNIATFDHGTDGFLETWGFAKGHCFLHLFNGASI